MIYLFVHLGTCKRPAIQNCETYFGKSEDLIIRSRGIYPLNNIVCQ